MCVWYTHLMMSPPPAPASPPPAPASPPPDPARLDALDDVLGAVRRVLQRPEYRRRLLAATDGSVDLGSLRTLRVVERRAAAAPSVGDVADALGVDPSTASRTVDRCVCAGLLARTPSDTDRRRTQLTLTDRGRETLDQVTTARRQLLAEVAGDWDVTDLDRLTALLRTLLDGFDRVEGAS
jgi:DNA-binding MarR family transcriptional regulator